VHQGKAAEHLIAKVFVRPGDFIPINYHFTTTRAHFEMAGGTVLELYYDEALQTRSTNPYKGSLDPQKFLDVIKKHGKNKIPFVRMEATANLLGGQPFSIQRFDLSKRKKDGMKTVAAPSFPPSKFLTTEASARPLPAL
jgi:tryptophanase